MLKILFVEENPEIARTISDLLCINGYDVCAVRDHVKAWAAYRGGTFDIVVLKGKELGLSGFDLLRIIREADDKVLVIMQGDYTPAEIVTALVAEADNYVTGGCTPKVLLAYLAALVRVAGRQHETKCVFALNERVSLNLPGHMLCFPDKVELLNSRECLLLGRLAMNKGKVVERDKLIHEVWAENTPDTNAYLGKAIMQLRSLLKADPSICIETVRGRGYMLMSYETEVVRHCWK